MIYFPQAPYTNDPISDYAAQALTEWAWHNGHRATKHDDTVRCACGCRWTGATSVVDTKLREHWGEARLDKAA